MTSRIFEDKPAVRTNVPLLLGIVGPSGTGKTFSALRLATGIQRISGGEIFGIDTESGRMKHYAPLPGEKPDPSKGRFEFRHVPFGAPFDSLDYLAGFEHCVNRGAKIVIVDSMSHEHEGPGGVLEQHRKLTEELAAKWRKSEEAVQMSAWGPPKEKRRRLINTLLQLEVHAIFCFRAKEKLRIVSGEKPKERGWMPIAGEEFIYEMTCKFLLLPGSRGVPEFNPEHKEEKEMTKQPEQFLDLFARPRQLDEDHGQEMARWAAGVQLPKASDLLSRYVTCEDVATLDSLEDQRKVGWGTFSAAEKKQLKDASDAIRKRLALSIEEQERAAIAANG